MREMMEHILKSNKTMAKKRFRSGIMVTEATDLAIEYIKSNRPTAPVTR